MKKHFGKIRIAAALIAAMIAAMIAFAAGINLHVHRMARPRIIVGTGAMTKRDAAIVLGARVYGDGTMSHALYDRVAVALMLYRERKVKRILITGMGRGGPEDEVAAMRRYLTFHGVRYKDILADGEGENTGASMRRAASLFGIKDAVVVTQRYHLDRALLLAGRSGIEAAGYPADRRHYKKIVYFTLREFFATIKDYLL